MSLSLNPESDLVAESDLRAALRPYQIAPDFEAGIRRRIQATEAARAQDPLADAPQLLRVAAAVLPLPIISAGKVSGSALPLVNASGLYKLVGIVAMPAISLFLLLGAGLFGAVGIRRVQAGNIPADMDQRAMGAATPAWWRRHKWGAGLLFAVTLGLPLIGATSLMLLMYAISLGAMLYLLSGFARLGLANRTVIGRSVLVGLALLGQVSGLCTIGMQDIHFVDQMLLPVVFYCGILFLLPVIFQAEIMRIPRSAGQRPWLRRLAIAGCLVTFFLLLLIVVPVMAWFTNWIWQPTTPASIKQHVEAFDEAPYSTVSWRNWEIVATWAIESGLDPDLSRPRQLLEAEMADAGSELDPFLMGSALRSGLVRGEDLARLQVSEPKRQMLFNNPPDSSITSLTQMDWVIRVLEQRHELSSAQKDHLEQRLLATMDDLSEGVLEEALRVTQLLEVIGRPIDRNRYRARVGDWLREYHCTEGGGFQLPGGFKAYRNLTVGSLEQTSYAVDLMRIYGTPDGLDLNWVRSYLRPLMFRPMDDKYVAAITLDRLNKVPGVSFPTLLDYVYYERSLMMAALLVALCLYATISSPVFASSDKPDKH